MRIYIPAARAQSPRARASEHASQRSEGACDEACVYEAVGFYNEVAVTSCRVDVTDRGRTEGGPSQTRTVRREQHFVNT